MMRPVKTKLEKDLIFAALLPPTIRVYWINPVRRKEIELPNAALLLLSRNDISTTCYTLIRRDEFALMNILHSK